MRRVAIAMLLMLVPAALFAASMQNAQTAARPQMPGMAQETMGCPMNLKGTSVAVTDTANGVVISITTKPENVAELQKRTEQMAAMHVGQASSPAMMQGQMMAGTVKYEAAKDGAKLTLTPKDPAKLAEFRTQVRSHVERMQKGECTMMHDMMQGMMNGMRGGPEPKKDDADHSAHHPEKQK
jgi:hypothetical protein